VVAELVTTSVGVVNLVAAEAGSDPSPTIAAATDVKRIANARNPANRKMRITFLFLIFGNLNFGALIPAEPDRGNLYPAPTGFRLRTVRTATNRSSHQRGAHENEPNGENDLGCDVSSRERQGPRRAA
jgi:hypothetical protein